MAKLRRFVRAFRFWRMALTLHILISFRGHGMLRVVSETSLNRVYAPMFLSQVSDDVSLVGDAVLNAPNAESIRAFEVVTY